MAVKIETLELEIRSQAESASKGIDSLTESLKKLKRATTTKSIEKLTTNLSSLNSAINGISGQSISRIERLANAMDKLANASAKMKAVGMVGKNVKSINKALSGSVVDGATQQRRGLEKAQTGNATDIGQAYAQMGSFSFKAGLVASTIQQGIGNALATAGSIGKKTFSIMSGALGKVGTLALKAGSNLASAFGQRIASKAKGFAKSLKDLFKSVKRIAMYRLIRSAIKAVTEGFTEGVKAVSRYSRAMGGQFSQTMDKLTSQLALMKGSLGAMAMPLIEMLAPAIMTVTNAVISLANALNQVFSLMSGKSGWTQATGAVQKYDDAVGGASKSQKALTAGIDELNVLSDSSGGGGGAGTADYTFAEQELSSWAKSLKEFFDIGDYLGGGSYLADIMNKLVDGWNAKAWGKQLGGKIQNAIEFAYGFMTKIDTANIGSKIAQGLNGIMESIDFDMLGKLIAEKWNRIVDLIRGFVTTFDWKGFGTSIIKTIFGFISTINLGNIASTLSSLVLGIIDTAKGILEGTDWSTFGQTLFIKIKDFVTNIDWLGIIQGAFMLAGELIGASLSLLYGFLGEAIRSIGQYLETHTVGEMLAGIFNLITSAITSFLSGLDAILGTDMAGGFENALSSIGQFFVDTWNGIQSIWLGVGEWFNTNVIQPIVNFFTPILTTIGSIFEGCWMIIQACWVVASTWFNENVIIPIVNFFAPIVEKVGAFFTRLWNAILRVWNPVANWFNTTVIQPVITFFEPIVEKIGGIFDRLWEAIKTGVTSAMNFVIEKIESALNGVIDMINGLISGFSSVVEWAGDVLDKDWSGIGQISHVSFPRLANGGSVGAGDLFLANEAGPELISSSNGRTNVLSNDDVVRSVTDGVYNAVVTAMAQSNGKAQTIQVFLNGKQIEASSRETKQRRGATIASGGIYNYA